MSRYHTSVNDSKKDDRNRHRRGGGGGGGAREDGWRLEGEDGEERQVNVCVSGDACAVC